MAWSSLFQTTTRPDLHVCASCALKFSRQTSRRWISQKFLAKVADAELKWQEQALEIRQGKRKSMLTTLEDRGLVHSVTGSRDEVDRMMTDRRVGAYVGIDPTAASLHVGHLLPLMSLFWMYVHGYHTITLVGGATSKIGDPTDRLTTREEIHRSLRAQYMVNIHYQLKKMWLNVEAYGSKYGYKWEWAWKRALLNNNTWMNKLPIMELLQILGPGMRIGPMLAKDTVKNKLKNGDGMSFAEFTYPILQSWDWWHMYNTLGVRMQIGGADQYGNITAGIDAVKYIAENHPAPDTPKKTGDPPFGLTVPLLTTSSGAKFGKSAGNAVWLDSEMTSTFDLYGYFVRTSDADVGRYLKLFTFMKLEDIDKLLKKHMESPSQRIAQHKLACEVVELVHGKQQAFHAENQHRLIFGGAPLSLVEDGEPDLAGRNALNLPQVNLNNRPKAQMTLPRSLIETGSIGKIVFAAGLAESASHGHRLAMEQSVYIGGSPTRQKMPMNDGSLTFAPIKLWKPEETKEYLIGGNLLILRKGKHNIRIIEVVDDEEYKKSELEYPGMKSFEQSMNIKTHQAKVQEQGLKTRESGEFGLAGTDLPTGLLEDDNPQEPLGDDGPQWADLEDLLDANKIARLRKAGVSVRDILKDGPENDGFEGVDAETRLMLLNRRFEDELAERQRKWDEKNAPKPKFTGHFKKTRIYNGRAFRR